MPKPRLFFVIAPFLVWCATAPWAARALIAEGGPRSGEAVMVLSGSGLQAERIGRAATVLMEGRARRLILTNDGVRGGWSRQRQARLMMVDRAKDALTASGVALDAIVELPGVVRSTYDEAVALRAYVSTHPMKSVVIVTSGYHSRRALWVFRRVLESTPTTVGIDPVPPGDQSPAPGTWWLTMRGWRQVAAEYPKFAYYYFTY
ncbi:MAG: YdcF family protein [Vicinamibacterales bacterium]